MACIIERIKSKSKHGNGLKIPRDFRATEKYIRDASGHGDKLHMLDGEEILGTLNSNENWEEACDEIVNIQKKFKGRGEPTAHYVISYAQNFGETLSAAEIKKDVEILMYHLGYYNHEALYAVHSNTKNLHTHVVINRLSNNKLPFDVGTVVKKDGAKMKRYDPLCQHAAMFDICDSRGWDTSMCLVDSMGTKIKEASKEGKISQGALAEESRTGEKSKQRLLLELLQKHEPPTTKKELLNFFVKHDITFRIRKNQKGDETGLVYKYSNINMKSSLLPERWRLENILPILSQQETLPNQAKESQVQAQEKQIFLDKATKDFLYKAFDNAKRNDFDFTNLAAFLASHGYTLENGRVSKDGQSCKFSEIYRGFSLGKMQAAFQENLIKHNKTQETFVKSSSHHHYIYDDDFTDQQDLQDQQDQAHQQQQFNNEMEFTYEQPSL